MIEYIKRVDSRNMNSIEEKTYYEKLIDKIEYIENTTGLAIIDVGVKNQII